MVLQVLVVFLGAGGRGVSGGLSGGRRFFKFLNCKEESNDEDDVNYTTKDLKKLDSVL